MIEYILGVYTQVARGDIDDILDMSRIESGKMTLKNEDFRTKRSRLMWQKTEE